MYTLEIPNATSNYFLINSASRTIMGAKVIEYTQDKIAEIAIQKIDQSPEFFQVHYRLHEQKTKGTALIHQWMGDMDELQSEMFFIMNAKGELVRIARLDRLRQTYEKNIRELRKKYPEGIDEMIDETRKLLHDEERMRNSFVGYSSWRFLFGGQYREYDENEQSNLLLKGYFGNIDLPLIISSKTESFPETEKISFTENVANLDKKKFDRKAFARMLKDLTNTYNIDATLSVDMEERYQYSQDGSLLQGDIFLETSVTDWYSVINAHQIKKLTEEEIEAFSIEKA